MKIFEDKCPNFSLRDCVLIDSDISQVLVQGGESVVNKEKVLAGAISNIVYINVHRCQNWRTLDRCGAAVVSGGLGKMVYIIS